MNAPGAGKYEAAKTFGKMGEKRSFGSRLNYAGYMSKKKASLPGPGEYLHPDMFAEKLPSSLNTRAVGQVMTKAKDRFFTPMNRRTEPAPGQYSPKTTMKDDLSKDDPGAMGSSLFKKNARAVFGKSKFSILDDM